MFCLRATRTLPLPTDTSRYRHHGRAAATLLRTALCSLYHFRLLIHILCLCCSFSSFHWLHTNVWFYRWNTHICVFALCIGDDESKGKDRKIWCCEKGVEQCLLVELLSASSIARAVMYIMRLNFVYLFVGLFVFRFKQPLNWIVT